MKKAQTEMIGLVIIVILITLGMLFAAQFAINDAPEKKIFTRKGLAYSTVSTILVTEFQCGDNKLSGKELLKDCYDVRLGSGLYNCGVLDSCEFFEDKISTLFSETLDKWGTNYEFTSKSITGTADPLNLVTITPRNPEGGQIDNPCKGKDIDTSNPFPIPFEGGLIQNLLLICD